MPSLRNLESAFDIAKADSAPAPKPRRSAHAGQAPDLGGMPTKKTGSHRIAEHRGWKETGGGKGFKQYERPGQPGHALYVHDDGSWEHHDFNTQTQDMPQDARATGKGPGGLMGYAHRNRL